MIALWTESHWALVWQARAYKNNFFDQIESNKQGWHSFQFVLIRTDCEEFGTERERNFRSDLFLFVRSRFLIAKNWIIKQIKYNLFIEITHHFCASKRFFLKLEREQTKFAKEQTKRMPTLLTKIIYIRSSTNL